MHSARFVRGGMLVLALVLVVCSKTRGQETQPVEAQRLYASAVALQNKGNFELAAEGWADFLKRFPSNPLADRAWHYQGVCLFQTKKLDEAKRCFEYVQKKFQKSDLTEANLLYLGTTLQLQGTPESLKSATAVFQEQLKKFPKGKYAAQALYNLGDCFYALKRPKESVREYEKLLKEFPDSKAAPDTAYALGVTLQELEEPEAARERFTAVLEKWPEFHLASEVEFRLGETFAATKDYTAAAKWFEKAAADPKSKLADFALYRRAGALAELKDFTTAATLYASVARKYPDSRLATPAALAAGKCAFLAGDYQKARESLRPLLEAGGDAALEAAHWAARACLKQSEPGEALRIVESVLPKAKKGPWAAQVHLDKAEALWAMPDRKEEALTSFEQTAEAFPDDATAPQAAYLSAFGALELGKFKESLRLAESFAKRYPKDPLATDVRFIEAESRLQLDQAAEAEKCYAELLASKPGSPDAGNWRVRRALAQYLQKKYGEAVETLKSTVNQLKPKAVQAEGYRVLGDAQGAMEDYPAAIASYQAALSADPDGEHADEILLALSGAFRARKDWKAAEDTAGQLLQRFPKSPLAIRAKYRMAESAYAREDYKTAEKAYQEVLSDEKAGELKPFALSGLGWTLLGMDRFADAEATLNRLIAEYPKSTLIPRARYARGMARQQLGKFGEAGEDVRALLTSNPSKEEMGDALYVLGLCQMGTKDFDEAAKTFERLLKDYPNHTSADEVLYELAWSLKERKQDEAAAKTFRRLIENYPDSPLVSECYFRLGESAYDRGDFQDAAVAFYEVVDRAGDKPLGDKAAHRLGWAYYREKKYEQAIQAFQYERKTWPKSPLLQDSLFMEAECLFEQEKYQEALGLYETLKSPSTDAFQVVAALHASEAAGKLGDWKKSLELAKASLAAHPKTSYRPELLYQQAWALQNLQQYDKALPLYREVIENTNRETAAKAQFMIGEVLFLKKEYKEAILAFYRVIYGYSYPQWQADATYEAGRCFEMLKNTKQAKEHYRDLIRKFPDSDKAKVVRERLRELL